MTSDQIIYQRRLRTLAAARELGNVSEACRRNGVSRTTFYEWLAVVAAYGLEALMPKARRSPQLPNATPTHVVAELLTLAVIEPTLGCRQYADRLADRGFVVSKTTVNNLLATHQLSRRAQRVAKAAEITAATQGLLTKREADRMQGFCHFAARPGDLVALDGFYIGNLKGVGPLWQLTAVDTATRLAMVWVIAGAPNAVLSAQFLAKVVAWMRRHGHDVRCVLSDNGPEWIAGGFTQALAARHIRHLRTPPRSPNYNAVCERFQGTMLEEGWRPAFHRRSFHTIGQVRAEANAWLIDYNHRRRNHGDFMHGRTPIEVLAEHAR